MKYKSYKDAPSYRPLIPFVPTIKNEGDLAFNERGETIRYDDKIRPVPVRVNNVHE